MGNVISVIDALAEEKTGGENIEPKVMTADLAQSLYAGELRVPVNANMPRTGAMTNFMYGLVDTADAFVNDTPEQIKILGGQYDVVMGGLKGDEERIKRGRMNMDTANRNLQFNQQQRDMLTPDAAKDTFGYALGSGVASYGTMVVGGYGGGAAARALGASAKAAGRATGAAAYGTMAAMEVGGEVQERADKYAADTGDNAFKNYEPEKALKNLAAESAYGTISVILEKYLGFGEQRKLFNLDLAKLKSPTLRATASLTKTGVKTAVSEAGTEFAQSLANMGIDLIDGTMDWEQVPDRLKQELTGWAAAAVIGGTAGVGVGIYNRSQGIRTIKEEIRGTVPDADLERTASAIFDSAAEKMADVVSVELELSSQLRNKHGSVMDSMQRAVKQAVDESGAFQDVDEDMLAEYVVDTSKLFADQVLAEANIRNVPIEEVIQASDIVYENGGIRLKSQTEGGESRVLADSSVNVEGEQLEGDVSQEAKVAVKNVGYADFRNFIDEESNPISEEVFNKIKEAISTRGNNISYVELMNKVGKELDADMNALSMSNEDFMEVFNYIAEPNRQALEQGVMLRQGQIADNGRNVELTINSQEKLYQLPQEAYGAQGKADINTPEFKAWFGDSKVVDENGKPLEMVHFSYNEFSQFDKSHAGVNNDESSIGFWFADRDDFAFNNERYPIRYDVYLKMDNPLIIEGNGTETNPWADTDIDNLDSYAKFEKMFNDLMYQDPQMWDERVYEPIYGGFETRKVKLRFSNFSEKKQREIIKGIIDKLKAQGYDGIIIKNTRVDSLNPDEGINQYVVFEPNQIKSVYNRGTWNARNDNIYYQRAFAGSRVDYDRPSLEAIGTGEGNQAHGYGLYYALDKDVAERYRVNFVTAGKSFDEDNYKDVAAYYYITNNANREKAILSLEKDIAEDKNISPEDRKELDKMLDFLKTATDKELLGESGQVREVNIPENPYLLDEDKNFENQSEYVKDALKKFFNDKKVISLIKETNGNKAKSLIKFFFENKSENYSKVRELNELLFGTKTSETSLEDAKLLSELLYKYGIKGITYFGQQDGRCFVIFDPKDVKVIQKFHQEQSVEQFFSPTNRDKNTYISDLRAAERGEAGNDYNIRLGALPLIYQKIGIKNKPVKTKKTIILKDTISKHDVPMNVVENLLELYSNPLMIFKSLNTSTNPDSYVAVLDAVDKNGRQMIAALSPSKKENGYHLITSFYGRNNIDNMIKRAFEEKKVRYIRDKKNGLLTGHNAYLSQADDNILYKSDIVNSFMQQKPQPKGLYDTSKGVIKIFESADFSTLPHEIAHYWLDNMWSYVRSGNASEKYRQRWNVIANWLNVKPEQAVLTRGQQEKFARGYEQYLLNGDLPTPIIKGAFDDYDRWLKRVYGDMNRLNVRLSEDAVRFFQSMTTGILPPPRIRPSRKPREKMTTAEKLREQLGLQEQDRQEKETVKLVEEMEVARPKPDNIDARTVIVSNITEGETGKSRVYSREVERNIDALQEIADIDLDYNKIRLEEQAQRAADFVKNNLEDARKIIDGRKSAPENILDTAIRIAYEQEMLRIGDNAEYLRALKLHSSLQTLRGQEIVAERISTKDIASPTYWINKLVAHRTYKAASKIFKGYAEAVGGDSPVDLYKKMIKNETDRITKKVLAEKTREEQQKVLNAELKRLRYEYGTGIQGELFQMPLEPLNARNAKMYVREALDDIFGTTVSQEEANQIIGKIGEIEKSIVNTLDETGNPSVQTWQKINEMNNLVESLTPSPALQIATSIVGRGMMLLSVKSPVLNVVSNTENILTEMLIRRAVNSLEGGASFSAVDKNVEKDYLAYADDVYRASGYNVSTTEGLDAATVTLGERRISTQGAGKFRAFARGVETGVFKYLMGYPDSRAKDFVFSDTAALEATTIAQNEGLSGEMLSKRATELYRDATRVAPLTEEGMLIREKAMMEANVATYTNDTAFSKFALGIRETLNKVTGNVRLGDQLMPFVKTPANVVALGVEYSIGAAYLIPNLTTVIRDVKAGKLSAKSRTAIKAAVRNGLGVVLAMLIAMALDPDDYTPDYDALTMSERRLALEKNAVFNSIRIGDKYISLDYFGPLAVPLTAVLSARRRGEVAWFGYAKGVASQLQKLPGLQEFSETVDAIGRATSNKPEKTVKNLNNALIDFVRARTIPSIVNDLAKSIDTYERETSAGTYDKAKASIPGIRESLPLKYTTTSKTPRETEPAWSTVLFGARVKTAASNRVIYEIDRLYKKGAKPTITDVTRSGKLSELSEAKQQRVRKEFAKRYYAEVYTLIRTRAYRAKDDEQKAAAINKVRRQIIEQLKKTYIR